MSKLVGGIVITILSFGSLGLYVLAQYKKRTRLNEVFAWYERRKE